MNIEASIDSIIYSAFNIAVTKKTFSDHCLKEYIYIVISKARQDLFNSNIAYKYQQPYINSKT